MGLLDTGLLGRELFGRVVETAADVTRVSVGDRVMGLSFGTFGPAVTVHEGLLAPATPGMSMMELATVPSAFVTAAISFELAKLQAGDSVLVHAGAGGVGMAAIQLAQASGAEVFATASAPQQAYLRSLGVGHAFDSRQTNFGDEILQATNGAGVQVVLNKPDRRRLHRGQFVLPGARRPVRGAWPPGHLERGRDVVEESGCLLLRA